MAGRGEAAFARDRNLMAAAYARMEIGSRVAGRQSAILARQTAHDAGDGKTGRGADRTQRQQLLRQHFGRAADVQHAGRIGEGAHVGFDEGLPRG